MSEVINQELNTICVAVDQVSGTLDFAHDSFTEKEYVRSRVSLYATRQELQVQFEENDTELKRLREELETVSRGDNRESRRTRKIVKDVIKNLSDLKIAVDENEYVVNLNVDTVADFDIVLERISPIFRPYH